MVLGRNDIPAEYGCVISKLGRNSYLGYRDGRKCVIKLQSRRASVAGLFARMLVGGSLRFRNELIVNRCLSAETFRSLRFPRMLESDGLTCAVFDFVEGREGLDRSVVSDEQIVDSLIELHTLQIRPRYSLRERLALMMLRLPISLLRRILDLFWRQRDIGVLVRCLLVLIRCCAKQRPIGTGLLVHNDLLSNNILTDADGRWFIVDFENCFPESKWVLIDVVDVAFDRSTLQLDVALVSQYVCRLQKSGIDTRPVNLELQIRLILTCRIIQAIRSPRYGDADRSRFSGFLRDVLLNDSEFRLWLTRQRGRSMLSSEARRYRTDNQALS